VHFSEKVLQSIEAVLRRRDLERLLLCKARFARGGGCKSDARRLGFKKIPNEILSG